MKCRYGEPGDWLWVKETYRAFPDGDTYYRADAAADYIPVHADDAPEQWRWQSGMLMPRVHSRITLELTKVRVERVQQISKADCMAEGMPGLEDVHAGWHQSYAQLWDSINAKRGFAWEANPWVWVLECRKLIAES
jgi:hypothetical protein